MKFSSQSAVKNGVHHLFFRWIMGPSRCQISCRQTIVRKCPLLDGHHVRFPVFQSQTWYVFLQMWWKTDVRFTTGTLTDLEYARPMLFLRYELKLNLAVCQSQSRLRNGPKLFAICIIYIFERHTYSEWVHSA